MVHILDPSECKWVPMMPRPAIMSKLPRSPEAAARQISALELPPLILNRVKRIQNKNRQEC